MKTLITLAFLGLMCQIAVAGEIFGTISDGGKPVPAGTKIEITAAGKTYAGESDKFGSYHVFVNEKGKCTLAVLYKEQKPAADIFSYDRATRYDWNVESSDNKLALKRK
jgi:hypothetical protein